MLHEQRGRVQRVDMLHFSSTLRLQLRLLSRREVLIDGLQLAEEVAAISGARGCRRTGLSRPEAAFPAHARSRQVSWPYCPTAQNRGVVSHSSMRAGGLRGSRKGNSHTADTMVCRFLRHRQRKTRTRRCEVLNSAEGLSFRRRPSRRHSPCYTNTLGTGPIAQGRLKACANSTKSKVI